MHFEAQKITCKRATVHLCISALLVGVRRGAYLDPGTGTASTKKAVLPVHSEMRYGMIARRVDCFYSSMYYIFCVYMYVYICVCVCVVSFRRSAWPAFAQQTLRVSGGESLTINAKLKQYSTYYSSPDTPC